MLKHVPTVALLLLAALGARAGVVLEAAEIDPASGSERSTTTIQAQDGQLRMEHFEGSTTTALVIFRDDALQLVDPADRSFVVVDRAGIRRLADTVNPALRQMQEQLERMAPEQRAMVEQMLENAMPGALDAGPPPQREVRRTEREDEAAGLRCRVHEVLVDGVLEREACVVPAGSMPGGTHLYEALAGMGRLLGDIMDSIDAPWLKRSVDEQWMAVEELGGVPILSREYLDGEVVSEVVLRNVHEEVVPAGSFEVPEGYRQRELAVD